MKLIKKLVVFLALALYLNCVCAQENQAIDSLFKLLNDELIDSNQLSINQAIADYYLNLNLNKAIEYYERSKYLAEKLNSKSQLASSYYSLGSCFLAKGNFDLSLENYLKAVRLYEELNHKRRLTKTYIDIAYLYTEYAYYSKAHDYFDKAKLLIDQSQDTLELNYYFQEKGNFYFRQANLTRQFCVIWNPIALPRSLKMIIIPYQIPYQILVLCIKKWVDWTMHCFI